MIAFLLNIYVGIVFVLFKKKWIKPQPIPIAIVATVGVLMIGGIVIFWTAAAPMSSRAVVTRYVVQIVPVVKGQVKRVVAKPNVLLKKGVDVLFEIDPAPYVYALAQAEAQLAAAKSNVVQVESGVNLADAKVESAKVSARLAKTNLDVAEETERLGGKGAVSKIDMAQAKDGLASAQATVTQSEAGADQARTAVTAAKDAVAAASAAVDTAKFNLSQCVVKAPADGFVTDWQIREGTYVTALPLAPAGTFIDTSETSIAASFPANTVRNVKAGDEVELAFKSRPGVLYRGKVDTIIQASGEGQFETTGKLGSAASIGSKGFLAVKILLDDQDVADSLEMGTPATVAIYTDWGRSLSIISRVTVRMQKWIYYLPF